jgi:hypothetical protein
MFEGVEGPYELIFCILSLEKSDLNEVALAMFYVGEWP